MVLIDTDGDRERDRGRDDVVDEEDMEMLLTIVTVREELRLVRPRDTDGGDEDDQQKQRRRDGGDGAIGEKGRDDIEKKRKR